MEIKARPRRLPSYLFAFLAVAAIFCWHFEAHLSRVVNDLPGYSIIDENENLAHRCSEEHAAEPEDKQNLEASTSNSCFRHNSEKWLTGTRLSNAEDDGLTKEYVQDLIEYASQPLEIETMKKITSQTICHAKSNFTNPSESRWSVDMADEAYFRLIYMSIYHLFHAPALEEMRARRDCKEEEYAVNPVPNFDYECPKAKFFVAAYTKGSVGSGSAIRNGIVSTMLDAIGTGRIPIFLNNVPGDGFDDALKRPSMLISCDRGDLQCFYMPVSPCTLTLDEIQGLKTEHFSSSSLIDVMADPAKRDARVWVVSGRPSIPYTETRRSLSRLTRNNLYKTALKLIEKMMAEPGAETAPLEKWQTLHRAASNILDQYDHPKFFDYMNDKEAMVHAGLMYFMRPKPAIQQKIDSVVGHLVPAGVGRDSKIMGMMIRATDKCISEATCLSGETYQDMAVDLRNQTGINDIILTSEDRKIVDGIVLNNSSLHKGANYIFNKGDVSPGSGNAKLWIAKNISADDIMMSALTVLKLQLHSSLIFANCCSNFHNVLLDLYREGCGMAEHGKFQCMQDLENPKYQTCCLWSKGAKCQSVGRDIRNQARRVRGMTPEAGTPPKKAIPKKGAPKKGAPKKGAPKKAAPKKAAPKKGTLQKAAPKKAASKTTSL